MAAKFVGWAATASRDTRSPTEVGSRSSRIPRHATAKRSITPLSLRHSCRRAQPELCALPWTTSNERAARPKTNRGDDERNSPLPASHETMHDTSYT
jgi:hypothetical protein